MNFKRPFMLETKHLIGGSFPRFFSLINTIPFFDHIFGDGQIL